MKIKIIELLNKIAKGEEVPEKIKYGEDIFTYYKKRKDYIHLSDEEGYYSQTLLFKTQDIHYIRDFLEVQVEIVESNKTIEDLELDYDNQTLTQSVELIKNKINELVKEINKIKEN